MTHTSKALLRTDVSGRLKALPSDTRKALSAAACTHLEAVLEGLVGGTLLGYLPLPTELDVMDCMAWWLDTGSRLCGPAVHWDAGSMQAHTLDSLDPAAFNHGRHGVREPASQCPLALDELNAVLVPGLAFDAHGQRLGRGGGFYDRLLAQLPDRVQRIGVCFDEQCVGGVPVDAHDQCVNMLVTPTGVHTCCD
jgi:5-formyltetrahydrofolate cyclo-ligase